MTSSVLIGAAEAARILRCDRATVTRLAVRGDLRPELKFPGVTGPRMFRRADVEALAAARGVADGETVAS